MSDEADRRGTGDDVWNDDTGNDTDDVLEGATMPRAAEEALDDLQHHREPLSEFDQQRIEAENDLA